MVVGCTFHIYDLFLWKVSREKQCGIYCIDRIENVDKYKSASCLYHIDKMQIFSLYIIKGLYMDVTFMILATLVAVEHIYIMCLETIFTKSETTARTFNMEVEELSRPSVSTLLKNQGVYNLLLAVLILIAVWVTNDLFWTRCFLSYVALVAIYGGITSSPTIILKQGAPALVALIYSFVLL